LEETLKLKGYTPGTIFSIYRRVLEETLKLKGYTPGFNNAGLAYRWRRLSN